jgi:hypothetical protein
MSEKGSNKDMLAAALIFNLALVNLLAISVASNLGDMSLFTFGWTQRLNSMHPSNDMNKTKHVITQLYIANNVSTREQLWVMRQKILDPANCNPVMYDGALKWRAADVSPTCNCLENMHVEYVKSITPNSVRLTDSEMKNNDTKAKTEVLVQVIEKKCFEAIRHTQVRGKQACIFPSCLCGIG